MSIVSKKIKIGVLLENKNKKEGFSVKSFKNKNRKKKHLLK